MRGVRHALDLLDRLAEHAPQPVPVGRLVGELGIARSSFYDLVAALGSGGLVQPAGRGRLAAGTAIADAAFAAAGVAWGRAEVEGALHRLAAMTGGPALFWAVLDAETVLLAAAGEARATIGRRQRLQDTAIGRLVLAAKDERRTAPAKGGRDGADADLVFAADPGEGPLLLRVFRSDGDRIVGALGLAAAGEERGRLSAALAAWPDGPVGEPRGCGPPEDLDRTLPPG